MTEQKPKYVGDEFIDEEEIDEDDQLEGMYDLVLPPGVPYKVILEAVDKFDVEITTRRCALKTIDVEPENLIALRGDMDSVNNAYDYIYNRMSKMFNYKKDE